MSPAVKKVIYTVTSAGLLLASCTCVASNDLASSSVNQTNSTAAAPSGFQQSVAATQQSISETQKEPVKNTLALPADTTAQVNSANPYYKNANASPQVGSGAHLLNVTLGLLLIIGLIFGLSWFVKRFSQGTFSGNSNLKIIATMPLGTRERIVLIDAGGQQLLLGITPTNISTLHTFDVPIATNSTDANASDFGRKFMAILQRPSDAKSDANGNKNSEKQE